MYALLIAVTSDATALGATILNRLTITVVELALFVGGFAVWRLVRPSGLGSAKGASREAAELAPRASPEHAP
jgi:hypothetical protein